MFLEASLQVAILHWMWERTFFPTALVMNFKVKKPKENIRKVRKVYVLYLSLPLCAEEVDDAFGYYVVTN